MGPKARAPQPRTTRSDGRTGRADPTRPPDNPQAGSRASSRSTEVRPRHHAATTMAGTQSPAAWQTASKGSRDPQDKMERPTGRRSLTPEGQPVAEGYVSIPPMLTDPALAGSTHPSPFEQIRRPPVAKGKEREVDQGSTRHSRRESDKRSTTSGTRRRSKVVSADEFSRIVMAAHSKELANKLYESVIADRATDDPEVSPLSREELTSLALNHFNSAMKQMAASGIEPLSGEGHAPDEAIDQGIKNLGAPRGESERSSDYERRVAAAARYQRAPAEEPREAPPSKPKEKQHKAAPEGRRRERHYTDRVTVQRMRDGDIQQYGSSRLCDQGIGFDQNGFPYDKEDPANLPGPFKAPSEQDLESRGQRHRHHPDGDDGGRSDSSTSASSRSRTHSERSRHSRRSERSRRDRSRSRSREDRRTHGHHGRSKSPTSKRRRHKSRSKHRTHEGRRESPSDHRKDDQPHLNIKWPSTHASKTKSSYVKNIHDKYRRMIDEQVEIPLRFGTSTIKTGASRLPTPDSYNGEEDIEKFDAWLQGLLRWFKLNLYAGPELEREQIALTGLFLKDKASIWYNDNVEGVSRQQHVWTFHGVITSLYDRFIHEATIQDATSKYNDLQFKADNGVMGFYYDLERYSKRMVQAPDPYSFRTRFMFGLPRFISNEVLAKGYTAEKSSLDELVTVARDIEEAVKVQKRYDARRNMMTRAAVTVPRVPATTSSSRTPITRVGKHPGVMSRAPTIARPSATNERFQRPPEKAPGLTFKSPPPLTKPVVTTIRKPPFDKGGRPGTSNDVPPGVKCFNCGGPHYANKCPQGPTLKPRMAALQEQEEPAEMTNPLENQEEVSQVSQSETLNDVNDNVEEDQELPTEYEEPLLGSQYSSQGEEYPLELYEQYSEGEFEEVEQMFKFSEFPRTISSDALLSHVEDQTNAWAEEIRPNIEDDPEIVVEVRSLTDRVPDGNSKPITNVVRLSRFPKARPSRPSSVTRPLIGQMNINGLIAIVMFDSGSTADAVSPEFARVANMKIFALEEPVPIQLGCKGSRSKIVYGTRGHTQYQGIDEEYYFDVVNIDRYDAIIGIGFMRKFGIKLDPETDTVVVRGVSVPAILEGEEAKALALRHSLRRVKPADY